MDESKEWAEWREYVLRELKRLGECIIELDKSVRKLIIAVAKLQVKAGVWGLIGGAIPSTIAAIYILLKLTK
ncbi:hypothetical protein LCGC14_1367800 [marine sediment metagenome]|uniref:Uncharacterized protein n=1 Tax=marine sediment metagenome TaxID=412755 RepID=A0A0F9K666_9ZZZZ